MAENTAQGAGVIVITFNKQGKICIAGRAETEAELKLLMHVLSQLVMKLCGKFKFDAESLPIGADYTAAYEQYKTKMAMLTYVRDLDTITVYECAVNLCTYKSKVSELELPSRHTKELKARTNTCTTEQADRLLAMYKALGVYCVEGSANDLVTASMLITELCPKSSGDEADN